MSWRCGACSARKLHPEEDKFRYRVLWGYAAADADPSAADITNWVEVSWDTIYTPDQPWCDGRLRR